MRGEIEERGEEGGNGGDEEEMKGEEEEMRGEEEEMKGKDGENDKCKLDCVCIMALISLSLSLCPSECTCHPPGRCPRLGYD